MDTANRSMLRPPPRTAELVAARFGALAKAKALAKAFATEAASISTRIKICVLSVEDTARLENFGHWPRCQSHKHVTIAEANQMVRDDSHRWVGGTDTMVATPVTMITPTYLEGRTWKNKPVGGPQGMKVRQFVPA